MKHLLVVIVLSLLVFISKTMADFGQSCTTLPISSQDNYQRTDTAYGHLIGNIDTSTYVNGCNPNTAEILFCFKNPPSSSSICSDPVTITLGNSNTLGQINNSSFLGGNPLLANIILSVAPIGDDLCLMMPTSRGLMPITCKSYQAANTGDNGDTSGVCAVIGNSCFNGHTKSQSPFNFSGMAVNCLKESLDNVFYQSNECVSSTERDLINPFSIFQKSLQLSIGAGLIIYIIIFGFRVVMNSKYAELNSVATFIIKFVLVFYFAIGFSPLDQVNNNQKTDNGMLDITLPLFSQLASTLAEIVFNAGGSQGLCSFDSSRYEPGYEFYGLWDSIDCRIGYYLGMRVMDDTASIYQGLSSTQQGQDNNSPMPNNPSNTEFQSLNDDQSMRIFSVLFGFLLGGNVIILLSGLIFLVIFLSIVLHFLSSYLVCLVTLYAMTYISPIFVPMALFGRTKGYFDSWLKIIISCSVQPAVLAGFIALLVTMYDSAIYGNCEFARHDYSISGQNYSTFELRIPETDPQLCSGSAGFKIINYYGQTGWNSANLILFEVPYLTDELNLLVNLIYVLIFTVIFYYFSKFIGRFASDITSGPALDAVTISPTKVVEVTKKIIDFAVAVATRDTQKLKEMAKDAADDITKGLKPSDSGGGGEGSGSGEDSSGDDKKGEESGKESMSKGK